MAVIRSLVTTSLLMVLALGGSSGQARAKTPADLAAWASTSLAPVDAVTRAPDLAVLSTLYPVRWRVTGDGSLEQIPSDGLDTLLAMRRPAELRILPTVQNIGSAGFDGALLRATLADPAKRERLLTTLTGLLDDPSVGGLNIDFEGLGVADSLSFTAFIGDLRTRMAGRGQLSVCVAARTAATPSWEGARFVDWDAIGILADEVIVMAYDFSWPESPPGPVSPVSWFDEVLDYALTRVPPQRLRFGLPLYGYVWTGTRSEALASPLAMRQVSELDRRAWHPAPVPALVRGAAPGAVIHLRSVDGDTVSELYIDDVASLREKIGRARARGVERFAFWELAHVDPGVLGAFR